MGVCFSQTSVTLAADFAAVRNSEVSARRVLTVHCSCLILGGKTYRDAYKIISPGQKFLSLEKALSDTFRGNGTGNGGGDCFLHSFSPKQTSDDRFFRCKN